MALSFRTRQSPTRKSSEPEIRAYALRLRGTTLAHGWNGTPMAAARHRSSEVYYRVTPSSDLHHLVAAGFWCDISRCRQSHGSGSRGTTIRRRRCYYVESRRESVGNQFALELAFQEHCTVARRSTLCIGGITQLALVRA